MKKFIDGKYIEMTTEEIAARETEQRKYELAKKPDLLQPPKSIPC